MRRRLDCHVSKELGGGASTKRLCCFCACSLPPTAQRHRRSITLQNQLDGVFASLDHYRRGKEGLSQKRSHFRRRGVRVGVGNRVGFKIVIVGDSTMRVSGLQAGQ